MKVRTINFVAEYTDTPGGRYKAQGDHSGELFRESILKPAIQEYDSVVLDLNGVFSLPPSFIDEAIGILVDQLGEKAVGAKLVVKIDDNPIAKRRIADVIRDHSSKKS